MSKSNVNPNHYKVAGRERQGEDVPQVRNKQKRAESLVTAPRGPHARFAKATPVVTARPLVKESAKKAGKTSTTKASTRTRKG